MPGEVSRSYDPAPLDRRESGPLRAVTFRGYLPDVLREVADYLEERIDPETLTGASAVHVDPRPDGDGSAVAVVYVLDPAACPFVSPACAGRAGGLSHLDCSGELGRGAEAEAATCHCECHDEGYGALDGYESVERLDLGEED